MITEIKDLIESVLVKVGIEKEVIARNKYDAVNLKTSGVDFYAELITDPGSFGNPLRVEGFVEDEDGKKYVKVTARRRLPLVVKIVGLSEEEVDPVFSRFLGELPASFKIGLLDGSIELREEEHSDFDAAMDSQYESAAVVVFSIDIGPEPLSSKKVAIKKIETGGMEDGSE